MDDPSSQASLRVAQTMLQPLHFLLGSWQGSGVSHGEAVTATLNVRLCLSGTFVEATEVLRSSSGEVDHEDISFYRYDDREGHLRVRQLMPGAIEAERMVLSLPTGGIRWFEGPVGVHVHFVPQPDGTLLEKVFLPFQESASLTLHYQRIS